MMFLLGKQAMLWHDPPIYLRSISATRFPCSAVVHAAIFAPVPLPSTTKSYSSVCGAPAGGTVSLSIGDSPFVDINTYLGEPQSEDLRAGLRHTVCSLKSNFSYLEIGRIRAV